jgi:polyisoprenoid-binding protein YceI
MGRQPGNVLRKGLVVTVVALGLATTAGTAAGAESWRIEGGDVKVLVPVKPGGTFEAKTTSLAGSLTPGSSNPLPLTGEVVVDLATIDTGIGLRDRHLREKLELERGAGFDKAVLSDIVVTEARGAGFRGESGFTGTLRLHGVSRPLRGKAEIRGEGPGVRVVAEFVLPLPDFGIDPPSYMGVGVTNKVVVTVSFAAAPSGGNGR